MQMTNDKNDYIYTKKLYNVLDEKLLLLLLLSLALKHQTRLVLGV